MSANPQANGGLLLRDLRLPDFRDYAVDVDAPGRPSTRRRGSWARSCATSSATTRRPSASSDRTRRPRTGSTRCSRRPTGSGGARSCRPTSIGPDGRVMEVLSEHLCQGWLEGYLLTGRHGLFSCYEAFIHIIDSMFNQHAKWLKMTARDPLARGRSPR